MTDRVPTRATAAIQGLPGCAPGILRARLAQVRAIGASALAVALLLPGGALAQAVPDATGGAPLAYVDIGTYLRYQDNDPGDEEQALETRLGVGYFLATSGQRLSFEGALVLQAQEDEPALDEPLRDPVLRGLFPGHRDLGRPELFAAGPGGWRARRGVRRGRSDRRWGSPRTPRGPDRAGDRSRRAFGTATEFIWRDDSFSDGATDDDVTFASLGTTLRFTLDPRITLRATGFLSHEETDDALETFETVHSYGLGADLLINRLWTANIDFGYRETETETLATTRVVEGSTAALLLTRDMRNGVLSFSAVRDITATGFEDTIRLARALTLGNGAEVGLSLGAVIFEGADPIAIYGASYANEIRPGTRFILSFDRSGGITADDENVIRTRLAASLAHNLTEASSLVLGANLSQVEDASLAGMDTARVDLSLAYRYALTRDWTLAARATQEIVFEDGAEDDRTTTLSIGIERRFSFRP
jgi:hypothetical protein